MTDTINNKWRHGPTRFELPALDDYMGMRDGLVPMPIILDPDVGEETVLFIRDQTPFMQELRRVKPFNFMMKNGCARNDFGPLIFVLFWVQDPSNPAESFAAWDCYLDPKNDDHMRMWRQLAAQTHWHLLLVGPTNLQENFFEIPNNFGLSKALDFLEEACREVATVDFNRAKRQFMSETTIDDLFQLK